MHDCKMADNNFVSALRTCLKKNAVTELNEKYRIVDFKVVEIQGPDHMPEFTMSVEVNGSKYIGQGKNKKIAKQAAAEAALRSITEMENPSDRTETADVYEAPEMSDFESYTGPALTTPDVIVSNESSGSLTMAENSNNNAQIVAEINNNRTKARKRKISTVQVVPRKIMKKDAVSALYQRYRNVDFKVVEIQGPDHMPEFTILVEVNGSEYKGKGKNKKTAKQAAAEAALRSINELENPSDRTETTDEYEAPEMSDFESTTTPDVSNESSGSLEIAENSNNNAQLVADKEPPWELEDVFARARQAMSAKKNPETEEFEMALVPIKQEPLSNTTAQGPLPLLSLHSTPISTPTPSMCMDLVPYTPRPARTRKRPAHLKDYDCVD